MSIEVSHYLKISKFNFHPNQIKYSEQKARLSTVFIAILINQISGVFDITFIFIHILVIWFLVLFETGNKYSLQSNYIIHFSLTTV